MTKKIAYETAVAFFTILLLNDCSSRHVVRESSDHGHVYKACEKKISESNPVLDADTYYTKGGRIFYSIVHQGYVDSVYTPGISCVSQKRRYYPTIAAYNLGKPLTRAANACRHAEERYIVDFNIRLAVQHPELLRQTCGQDATTDPDYLKRFID